MKVLILLVIVVVARGTAIPFALEESRASAQFRSEDSQGNYNYGYYEYPTSGEIFRREAGYHYKNAGPYELESRTKTFADPSTKSTTTITTSEAKPITYAFPAPAAAVAKTHTTVTESKPVTYAFPAPAAIPVAKSHTTITETKPISYAFPAPAAIPVAKSSAIITTAETKPVAYAFPAPAAVPVAKTIVAPAPLRYAFPAPAAIPIAKSSALTYAAAPIAAAPLAYAAPASKFSYSSQVINAPASYAIAPGSIAFAPRYALNPYFSSAPFYRPL